MVNFREFVTSSGLKVFGGKDSSNNDELVFGAKRSDILLHTEMPGSPFVNVGSDPSKADIKEASVFTAKYSQAWRDTKKDVVVSVFRRADMKKGKKAKEGSWEVLKRMDRVRVRKSDIVKYEESLSDLDE